MQKTQVIDQAPKTSGIAVQSTKDAVNTLLTTYCDKQIDLASNQSSEYAQLWHNIKQVVLSGGKRIRPYLLLASYELFGGTDYTEVMPVAAAQELIHISMLIHDDIIDRDDERHGQPNIAGIYKTLYKKNVPPEDLDHYALSAALLAGDLLISSAHDIIVSSALVETDKLIALELLHSSIFSVVGGELSDIESTFTPMQNIKPLHIAHYKTAIYSFVNPLICGAKLANGSEADIQQLRNYGVNLGIAFQLADDLLGVFGDEQKTGKSILSDLQEGKGTYLVQQTLALASGDQLSEFSKYFGLHTLDEHSAEKLRAIIVACGAKSATVLAIDEHTEKAREALVNLTQNGFNTTKLTELLHKATERDS